MKTFERDGKINFVDDANVLVGFDNESCCCEQFGHFFSWKFPAKIDDVKEEIDADGFNFDREFFKEVSGDDFDCGGMAVFRLTKGDEEIFLSLFNAHNGYYSHGFRVTVGGITIREGSL